MDSNEISVEVEGLAFGYGSRTVLTDVSFNVRSGEMCAVSGPNGAGKSTLLRVLAGLLRPLKGIVRVAEGIGYVPQEWGLFGELQVEENIRFFARAYGLSRAVARVETESMLERCELKPLRRVRAGELSHGWRRKLTLACALTHQPRVLLLDEVMSGLDETSRSKIWNIVEAEAARGAAVLLTTHFGEDIARCSAQLALRSAE
ncbi:MAG: ABC transporter ATP-binding protein [Bryobacteraceae bacterium]